MNRENASNFDDNLFEEELGLSYDSAETDNFTQSDSADNSTQGLLSENEQNWSEEKLAQLLGFETDFTPHPSSFIPHSSETSPHPSSLIPHPLDDPHDQKTQPQIASNPFAKLGVVGGVLGVVFVGAGVVLTQISGTNLKASSVVEKTPEQQEKQEKQEEFADKTGLYKTELALATQESQLKQLESSPKPDDTKLTVTDKPELAEKPEIKETVEVKKETEIKPQSPQQVSPPVSNIPVRNIPSPQREFPTPPPPKLTSDSQIKVEDPLEQWRYLASLGSYGQTGNQKSTNTTDNNNNNRRITPSASQSNDHNFKLESSQVSNNISNNQDIAASFNQPLPVAAPRILPLEQTQETSRSIDLKNESNSSNLEAEVTSQLKELNKDSQAVTKPAVFNNDSELGTTMLVSYGSSESNQNHQNHLVSKSNNGILEDEEAHILRGIPLPRLERKLQVGQHTEGRLITPIIWSSAATENRQQNSKQRLIVQLEQPLKNQQGEVLLKAGNQIIFELTNVQETGLVISEAIALIQDGVEYILPPGVLQIRGEEGDPLLAELKNNVAGEIASRDRKMFVFGALGKVGEILNRPDTTTNTTTTDSSFSQTVISSTDEPNLWGAVLEGGFNPLTEQIKERNQQEIDELLNRPQLWYIPSGQRVQIFVNSTFLIRMRAEG
jgi:hypothetical protein